MTVFKPGRREDLFFLAFSLSIGILAAVGAILFRTLIEIFQDVFWASGGSFVEKIMGSPWWLRILIPVSAGLATGPIITFLVPEARGPGVPEVIVSVASRQSTIRHRVTLLKALVTSLLIGSGASVGREGPIVQIGASIGSSLAQIFKLNPELRRVCLASGAAAGIAATFNAPITGTLFALEIILLDIEISHISHIIISAVVASVFSRIFWGEFPAFHTTGFHLIHYWELGLYLLVGLVAGGMAIVFIRMIYAADSVFRRLRMPEWAKPGLGGLLLGMIALISPFVMGVGYETVNLALANSLLMEFALLILALKTLATAVCIGSGMSGGIFAPSLVLGSALGVAVSQWMVMLFPGLPLVSSNYALAGMGAVVAGTTLAPMTAILTIFELTLSYQTILPLMVACISSTLVVKLLFGYSAYEMKLLRQGVNIVRGHDIGILRNLYVADFMLKEFEVLPNSLGLPKIISRVAQSPYPHFVVLNQDGELVGVLSPRDLQGALDKYEVLKDVLIANDLMTSQVVTLSATDNLENALFLFERHRISFIPVTEGGGSSRVLGVLKKDDLLQAYRERVLKDRILSTSIK